MIEVENFGFRYFKAPQLDIIKGLSFNVQEGDKLAIVGTSGGGKSTLLKCIAGIASDLGESDGAVKVFGKLPSEVIRHGELGFLFQDFKLLPHLNVLRNIEFPLTVSNKIYDDETLAFRVSEILKMVGLDDSMSKYPHELSGGMRARVALARSLITRPSLLLIDEAFSSLDIGWRNDLYSQINELNSRDKLTVIFVSHDLNDVVRFADSCLLINKGPTDHEYIRFDKRSSESILNDLVEKIDKHHWYIQG